MESSDPKILSALAGGTKLLNWESIGLRCGPTNDIGRQRKNQEYPTYLDKRELIPIRIEEHTAQISQAKGAAYQQRFARGSINILSCSTTFEMGIDLGDLALVFLANLPPGVSNYRQRAGRAGRRPGSPAYVVSFVGRNPHDMAYFDNPAKLIFGRVDPPRLYLSNPVYLARHLRAEAFHSFLRYMEEGKLWKASGVQRKWNHGGHFFLGRASGKIEWKKGRTAKLKPEFRSILEDMEAWVKDNGEAEDLRLKSIQDAARIEYSVTTDLLWQLKTCDAPKEAAPFEFDASSGQKFRELGGANQPLVDNGNITLHTSSGRREVEYRFRAKWEHLCGDNGDTIPFAAVRVLREQTIDIISRAAVLPKYGFPVDVIELLPDKNDTYARNVRLQRDLKIGLFEYAPGQVIMADKRLFEVALLGI